MVFFGPGGTVTTDGIVSIDGGSGTGGEAYLRLMRGGTPGFILNHTATAIQVRATANIPMFFYTNDTIGIKLNANSTVSFPEYAAGYLKTDASGNITADNTGGGLPGGPYLPLSAGSSYPLTGTLYGTSTNFSGSGDYAGSMTLGTGASTAEANLQIGQGRTGNGYSYIDLIGDATYSDYGFRIIRNNSGPNTSSAILHRGTGNLEISANDSASILLKTNGATALTLSNTQTATFAGNVIVNGAQDALTINTTDTDGPYAVWKNTTNATLGFVGNANSLASAGNTNFAVRAQNDLIFASGGGTERMRITSTGNVGIGTTSPVAKLHVEGNKSYSLGYLDATSDLHIGNDTMSSAVGAYSGSITFGSTNESNLQAASIVAVQTDTDPNEIGLAFFTQHSSAGSTDLVESMRIKNDGNVGDRDD